MKLAAAFPSIYTLFWITLLISKLAFSFYVEIRTLGMIRVRFESLPSAFSERLVPYSKEETRQNLLDDTTERISIAKFSQMWNEFILSMRNEDLISHMERNLLLVPYSSGEVSVVHWPPFLLARKLFGEYAVKWKGAFRIKDS